MQAQSCPNFLGYLQDNLPTAIPRNTALTTCQTAMQTLTRADRLTAQSDSDQTWYAVRTVASVAQAPAATLATYNDRYTIIKNTATAAVTKAGNDLLGKLVAAVAALDPAAPTIDPIITAAQAACTAYQTAAQAAINAARTASNVLAVDASNLMVTPLNSRGALFQACQPLTTNSRLLDTILNTLQRTTQNILINQNIKMKTCLQSISYSNIYKINNSNRLTRTQDLAATNKAVNDFAPPQGETDAAAVMTPLRSAAMTQLEVLRPLAVTSPDQYTTGAITFCAAFTQTLSDAINTARAATNTLYQTSVTNINKVIVPTTT